MEPSDTDVASSENHNTHEDGVIPVIITSKPCAPLSSGSSATASSCGHDREELTLSRFDDRLVEFLGRALEAVAREGDSRRSVDLVHDNDVFVGMQRVPHIALRPYLKRMMKYMNGSSGDMASKWTAPSLGARSLICALIYLDRIVTKTNLQVTSFRIHRLLAAGMLVSLKMNEDDIIDMQYFALLAGIPLAQLNKLESAYLGKLDFETLITEQEFAARIKSFKRRSSTPVARN